MFGLGLWLMYRLVCEPGMVWVVPLGYRFWGLGVGAESGVGGVVEVGLVLGSGWGLWAAVGAVWGWVYGAVVGLMPCMWLWLWFGMGLALRMGFVSVFGVGVRGWG